MTTTPARVRGSLGLKRAKVPRVIARAETVLDQTTAHLASYPGASALLLALGSQLADLQDAQRATRRRTTGMAAARNVKRNLVMSTLEALLVLIQALADAAAPEEAIVLIEGAGMKVAASTAHPKPFLQAKLGPTSGSVRLVANAKILAGHLGSRKKTWSWQFSSDGGLTWVTATPGAVANTAIEGLTALETYAFRVMVSTADVPGAWSQVVPMCFPTVELRAVA